MQKGGNMWILVIIFVGGTSGGITSLPNFHTKEACIIARNTMRTEVEKNASVGNYVNLSLTCVKGD